MGNGTKSPRQFLKIKCRGRKTESSFRVLLLLGVESDVFTDFGKDSAGHHRLNRRLSRTSVKTGMIISRKLTLEREQSAAHRLQFTMDFL